MKIRSLVSAVLVLVLAVSLCLGLAAPAKAAGLDIDGLYDRLSKAFGLTESDYENYESNYAASLPVEFELKSGTKYLALGATTAAGSAGISDPTKSYSDKLAGKLIVSFSNKAEPKLVASGAVTYIRSLQTELPNYNLITFQLDGVPIVNDAITGWMDDLPINWADYISDQSLINEIKTIKADLVQQYSAQYGADTVDIIATIVEHLLYQSVSYCYETMDAVKEIRKYNSNALILVPGLYNPMRGLTFNSGNSSMDVGSLMELLVDLCNVFLLKNVSSMKNVRFVDISDAATEGCGAIDVGGELSYKTMQNLKKTINKQYANQSGHDYIRDRLFGAMCTKHTNKTVGYKAATCTEDGYTGDTVCANCGKLIKSGTKIAATGHKYSAWTQTKAPNCTDAGEETRSCTGGCGKKETRSVAALGHAMDKGTVTKEPGCETKGTKTFQCTRTGCTHKTTEDIAATGHKEDAGKVTKEPTCEGKGTKTFACSTCKKTLRTEEIAALGHSSDNGTVTTQPTCDSKGTKTFKCTRTGCGKVLKTEDIAALGHSYSTTGTVTTQPTCETEGVKTYKCTRTGCSSTKTESVPATGHKEDAGTVTKEPTCEEKGVKTFACSTCKKTLRTEDVAAKGHSWDSGKVTKEPTCTAEGAKLFTCGSCQKTKTETVPANGHSWDEGTVKKEPGCETEGEKAATCTVCGHSDSAVVIPATGHSWDEGTVTKEPGCETEGEKTFTCTVCGKTNTETIAATGHDWDEGAVTTAPGCEIEGEKTFTCGNCQDTKSEPIPATGHSFGEYVSNNDATCQKDGTKTASCTGCDAKDTVEDPGTKKDHEYKDGACVYCGAEEPSNGGAGWIIAVVSVVVVGGAGAALYFLKFKKTGKKVKAEEE